MAEESLVAGWRGLSLVVGARLGRPVGVGRVRWCVESSGLPIGRRLGNTLVFNQDDVDTVVRLVADRYQDGNEDVGGADERNE